MRVWTFVLIGLDENGVLRRSGGCNLGIVCVTSDGGRLAAWGSEHNQRNINAVQAATMPCEIECDPNSALLRA
jgi:hypothetical protein